MIQVCLHGWGSSASRFQAAWDAGTAGDGEARLFVDGLEPDLASGARRWFPFSGDPDTLAASLVRCLPAVEAAIRARLAAAGLAAQQPFELLGHSQGAMLALALALRQRLPIVAVESYAGWLPPAYPAVLAPGAPASMPIALHSSRADRWVPPAAVDGSAARLRALGLRRVEHHISAHLPHTFSSAWLTAARSDHHATPA